MSSPRSRASLLGLALLLLVAGGLWLWLETRNEMPSLPGSPVRSQTGGPPAEPASALSSEQRTGITAESRPTELARIRVRSYPANTPIAGATIEVVSLDVAADAPPLVTGADGTVTCSPKTLASAKLQVSADGCFSATQLVGELPRDGLEISLCVAGRVHVRVSDTQHAPAHGALVTAFLARNGVSTELRTAMNPNWPEQNGAGGRAMPLTDTRGEWTIEGMPCAVPLQVTASNTIPATSVEVTIDPVRREAEVDIAAEAPCCLHGRLVWEDGHAVDPRTTGDEIRIKCLERMRDPSIRPFAYCGDDGQFTFCDLPPGRVNWRVEWPGELSRCTTLVPGTTDVGDIVLHHAELVTGRVYLNDPPEGFSYRGVGLVCWQDGRCVSNVPFVGSDGRFEVRLPAGNVRFDLATNRDPIGTFAREIPCGELSVCLDPFVGRLRIRGLAIDRRDPYIRLADPGEQRGSFDGARVAHQYGLGGIESRIGWKGDDLCAWFLPPGTYDVLVGSRKQSALVSLGRAVIVVGQECTLDAAGRSPARLRGVVSTAKGQPIAGTSITVCPRALLWSQSFDAPHTLSDEHGAFVFDALCPGTWTVFPSSCGAGSPEARSVELAPASEASVRLELDPPGAIEGNVKRHGALAAGAVIWVEAESDPWGIHQPKQQHTTTDGQGRFHVGDLVPGTYSIEVYSGEIGTPEMRQIALQQVVRAGVTTTCEIDLDFTLTRIEATRDGAPFTAIDDGYVAGPGGLHRLERLPGSESGWGAHVTDGPCLFLFVSKDIPVLDWPPTSRGYLIAYVPHAKSGQSAMEVPIGTSTLVVRARQPGVTLPTARLESVGVIGDVSKYFVPALLAGTDENGRRTFVGIPAGASVMLESDRWLIGPVTTQRVDLGTRTQVEIVWPPE